MCSASVIILCAFFARGNAAESADRLADRMAGPDENTEFENTVQGKVGHLSIARASPSATIPSLMKPSVGAKRSSSFSQQLPYVQPGTASVGPSSQILGQPRTRGAVQAKAHWTDAETKFTYTHVDIPYEEVPPSQVLDFMDKGWILLDVRETRQIERAAIHGAEQVPLYELKNDFSPFGIYQEMIAWGLGGWWMGGRPMKENHDFVKQVEQRARKGSGIIVVCQSGLRSKQAVKELYLAGFKKLAIVRGGLNQVRHNELPCEEEGCRLDLAGSGNVAGLIHWRAS